METPLLITPTYTRRLLIIPATHPRLKGTTSNPNDELKIALHDYRITESRPDALTLLFTHGTSFNKDLWHMLIDELLSDKEVARDVKRVVAIDAVTHGDSAVANAGKLGEKTFWPDIAYDILTVIQSLSITGPLIGIGHSFGGGTLAHAAVMSPSTFTATIFVEPILFIMGQGDAAAAAVALRRRDTWESLTDVQAAFEKSKGLRDWVPGQRNVYAESGTISSVTPEGHSQQVLKTPKAQEAATYIAAPVPNLVAILRESKGQHSFILGGRSPVISPDQRQEVVEKLSASCSITTIPDAGHLIPMTHPLQLVQLLRELILQTSKSLVRGQQKLARI